MKTRVLILTLIVLSVIVVIPIMAQEDNCVKMDIEIESTKNLKWETCYLEKYASLLIKTSSEEPTDNKIILQKDTFWNYDIDCSPTRFFTLINGEENFRQEEYFGDYRILSISLEKGENEIEIIIATIPDMSANEYCLTEPKQMLESPLKQFKSVISIEEIQCRELLVLMEKHDGSPACVMKKNFDKFIQRNWGQPISHNKLVMIDAPSEAYLSGMPISFKVTETGWGNPCNSMLLTITNSDTDEIVWNRSERHPCFQTPQYDFFTHVSYVPDSRISELSFEEIGNYKLKIESRNKILEHYFSVKLGE